MFSRFKETGLLGCPQCYHDFREYLNPMIRRIQGGLNLLGQRPGKNPENPEDSGLGELHGSWPKPSTRRSTKRQRGFAMRSAR